MRFFLKPRASRNLRRHGGAQMTYQVPLLAMSFLFWIQAVLSDDPVMTPDMYGFWVTQFQAEVWAVSIMLASTIYISGILINGNWRWSPVLRFLGAMWHVFTMGAFAWGAISVGNNAMFAISLTFTSVHVWFSMLNASDLIGAALRWGIANDN